MEQYSIIHTSIKQFIHAFLDEDDNFKLVPDDDALTPRINKKTFEIKYSYRTEILVLLQNCEMESLLLDYYFASTCYINNDFEDARFFINRIRDKVKDEAPRIKETFPSVKNKVVYQMLFMVLHEIAHGVFGASEDQKSFFYNLVDEEIKGMMQLYGRSLSSPFGKLLLKIRNNRAVKKIAKNSIPVDEAKSAFDFSNIKNIFDDFPNYIKDPRKKEELACDLYAMRKFQVIMSQQNIPEKEYFDFYAAGLNGIQFLSRYMWWDSFFVKQMSSEQYHKKTYFDPLRSSFFFTECVYAREDDPSDIEDFLYDKGMKNIPFFNSVYEIDYVNGISDRFQRIGEGVVNYNEQDKAETKELLIDAEDDILCCVMNI